MGVLITTRENVTMRFITYLLCWGVIAYMSILTTQAQNLHFTIPEYNVLPGENVDIDMTIAGMDSVVSMQFSIHFDASVISYDGFSTTNLSNIAIGDMEANLGILRFSWFDVEGLGVSITDDLSILQLQFTAIGAIGDESPISIQNEPLEIQLFQLGPISGEFIPMTLSQEEGLVRIIDENAPVWSVGHVICAGDTNGSINWISGNSTYTYQWSGPDGFEATTASINNLTAGIYTVIITDADGNIIDEQMFEVEATYTLITTAQIVPTDCTTSSGQATITTTGGTMPYMYTLGTTTNQTGLFTNLSEGTHTITIEDANGCQADTTIEMTALNAPMIDLGEDIELCEGEQATIAIVDTFALVQWSTGEMGDEIIVTATGDYSITVTNTDDCTAIDTISVTIEDGVNMVVENDFLEICPNDTLMLEISGANTYEWIEGVAFLSETNIANPLAFPDTTRQFAVEGTNSCGTDTLSFTIDVLYFEASAGADTCIVIDDELYLNASGGVAYQWLPNIYPVNNDTIASPRVFPKDSTTYIVNITNEAGCIVQDSVTVLVLGNPLENIDFINLITPNDDGANDVLQFKNLEKFGQNSLHVYNRWGKQVYSKVDYQSDEERFDGTFNGKKLPTGNYFYVLKLRTGEIKQGLTIVY